MKNIFVYAVLFMLMAGEGSAQSQQTEVKLKEVVVTATKTEKDPKDVTQSVTVISAEEIHQSSATSIAEVIQQVAGVSVVRQGPRGSIDSLSIRGASYSQVLVLLDGVRLNTPRDSGADLSSLPVTIEDIDRIEVVRGASSALYGADAVGGVVNIITKKPEKLGASITGAVGSDGYDIARAEASGKHGGGYYSVRGARETSDGYRINSDLEQWTVGGKWGYELNSDASVELTADYLSKDIGVPGSTVFGETPRARQRERDRMYRAAVRYELTPALAMKVSGYRRENDLAYQDPDYLDWMTLLPAPINDLHQSRTDGGEAQLTWIAADWNMFTAGYESKRDHLDSTSSGMHATSNVAWYLQDEINVGEPFIIVVGVRHDDHSVYDKQNTTRASARYLFDSGTVLRASYGESFRAPTFNDLYWSAPDAVGNPNLRPENGVEYEAGVEQAIGAGNRVKVAGFRRKVKDLINWDWMVFPMQPENIGRADIKGAEAELELRGADWLSFGMTYTYLKALDEATKDKIYSTLYPKNQFGGRITLTPVSDLSFTAEGRSVENYVVPGDPEWRYTVFDAKVIQKISMADGLQADVFFSMTNIFDRKYENARGYPMPPREIHGGVTMFF